MSNRPLTFQLRPLPGEEHQEQVSDWRRCVDAARMYRAGLDVDGIARQLGVEKQLVGQLVAEGIRRCRGIEE